MKLTKQYTHLLFSFLRSHKFLLFLSLTLAVAQGLQAQTSRTIALDLDSIASSLAAAPMEFSNEAQANPLLFSLPLPEGGDLLFKVVESPIMSADFAAAFPNIRTYSVQAVEKPAVQGRLTVSPNGLFGVIFTSTGMANIHPVDLLDPVLHEVTYEVDLAGAVCNFDEIGNLFKAEEGTPKNSISNGATRRTYEMAIVATGEFYNANGATVPAATAVVTASVNSIQAIYDRELAVRFTLLTPVIYTNPATDPFDPAGNRTLQAAETVAANFPIGTYDIGHAFHTYTSGGSGVAALGVVCDNSSYAPISGTGPMKAAGWSGNSSNTSNGWIQLSSHEFGHMFNMKHTFNGTGGSCTSNISSTTAYEIGSGTSIMSYSSSCQADNNIPESGVADNYFHANSLEAAHTYISGETCHTAASTGNTPPVVNANPCGGSHTIPKSTPFTLTGSATDANNDVVYYSWEQYDEDGTGTPTQGYIGSTAAGSSIAPLFRSYPPT
ncbi:MAG: reprolysin-like metallopeptidase, partial [Bacteroidota bacterium]